jgi:hypothetical protein
MDKLFDIEFLEEAFEFLHNLDKKSHKKSFSIFVKFKLNKILSYSKN